MKKRKKGIASYQEVCPVWETPYLWGSLHHEEVMTGPQLDRAVYKLQMGLNICLLEGINRVE